MLAHGSKEYLTKKEAAVLVIEERKLKNQTLHACNYDPIVRELLNLEERIERGIITFVPKPPPKPDNFQGAKGALSKKDANLKMNLDRRVDTTVKVKAEPDMDVKVKVEEDSNIETATSVNTSILLDDDQSELSTIKSEDWPMAG